MRDTENLNKALNLIKAKDYKILVRENYYEVKVFLSDIYYYTVQITQEDTELDYLLQLHYKVTKRDIKIGNVLEDLKKENKKLISINNRIIEILGGK